MKNGLLHRYLYLVLGVSMGLAFDVAVVSAGEAEDLLESLFASDRVATSSESHEAKEPTRVHREHGMHFHVRPGQQLSPTLPKSPRPASPGKQTVNATGDITNLVLLVRFRNHRDRELPGLDVYETIFNKVGGDLDYVPSGSALDYSREVSYNKMSIRSRIIGWIDLPETEQYYSNGVEGTGDGNRVAEAIRFALDHVEKNELVDFDALDRNKDQYVDLFGLIHSGYGAETGTVDSDGFPSSDRIWSHQWSIPVWTSSRSGVRIGEYAISAGLRGSKGTAPCQLGLLAHETAHLGRLPDLYDNEIGLGIGAWGLLGFSGGFKSTGDTPAHFSPWAKIRLKWITPTELKTSGTYRIPRIEDNPKVYKIQAGFPDGEYLLIENRQPVGFDRELPGGKGGLAIWHIDEHKEHNVEPGYPGQPGWPHNDRHYMVALLQADGRFDLERRQNIGDEDDLFRAGGVNRVSATEEHGLRPYRIDTRVEQVLHRISEISEPGELMTFRYDVEEPGSSATTDLSDFEKSTSEASDTTPASATSATAASSSGSMIPVAGAVVASAEFSHASSRRIHGNGVLLEAKIQLSRESNVHVRGSASVMSAVDGGALSTGISNDRSTNPSMWQSSVRLASVSSANRYSSLSVNCRRRLPPGSHVIRWVVRSKSELRFGGGGALIVEAFPCGP